MKRTVLIVSILCFVSIAFSIRGIAARQLVPLPSERGQIQYLSINSSVTGPENLMVNEKLEPSREEIPVQVDVVPISSQNRGQYRAVLNQKRPTANAAEPSGSEGIVINPQDAVIIQSSPAKETTVKVVSVSSTQAPLSLPVTAIPKPIAILEDSNRVLHAINSTTDANSPPNSGFSTTLTKLSITLGSISSVIVSIYLANKKFIN